MKLDGLMMKHKDDMDSTHKTEKGFAITINFMEKVQTFRHFQTFF